MKRRAAQINASRIRNFVFGVEDSLVSTVGLLAGIATGGAANKTIILTGVVLVFVEAFSMGVGTFLSEESADEYKEGHVHTASTLIDSLVMFVSYFFAGFIPILPYVVAGTGTAFWASIAASLLALFGLGVINGQLSRVSIVRNGLKMMILGGLAILVGTSVGTFFK